MHKPFRIHDQDIFTSASIGIGFVSTSYQSVEDLLRDVDTAMYCAKNKGRGRYELFDSSMHERSITRLKIEAEIRRALHNGEFVIQYQPVYTINLLELVGFEALIRWQHPVRGLILPEEFIHVAEETGLIVPIGEWVLRTACTQAQAWRVFDGKPLTIAVNLSAIQFNDQHLVEIVKSAIDESGFDPNLLEFEITESVAMRDIDKALEILTEFQKLGVSISIDDFGRGYSSLDHIRYLPTNKIKIDRSFINEITEGDLAIVTAIVTMAHQLRLQVIAEGVETKEQLSILYNINCDQVQGFLLGKAISPEAAFELISSDKSKGSQV